MQPTGPPGTKEVPPKSTLFCPDCGHQSRYDGDWSLVETACETRYLCPDCDRVITIRPRFDNGDSVPEPGEFWRCVWETYGENVRAWQTFWLQTIWPWGSPRGGSLGNSAE